MQNVQKIMFILHFWLGLPSHQIVSSSFLALAALAPHICSTPWCWEASGQHWTLLPCTCPGGCLSPCKPGTSIRYTQMIQACVSACSLHTSLPSQWWESQSCPVECRCHRLSYPSQSPSPPCPSTLLVVGLLLPWQTHEGLGFQSFQDVQRLIKPPEH